MWQGQRAWLNVQGYCVGLGRMKSCFVHFLFPTVTFYFLINADRFYRSQNFVSVTLVMVVGRVHAVGYYIISSC